MLAKLTSKNQITIPKGIMAKLPDVQYFDVDYVDGKILLKPLEVHGTDLGEVRAKISVWASPRIASMRPYVGRAPDEKDCSGYQCTRKRPPDP